MFRRVPPVHSPLSLAALSRGLAAALSERAWRAARAEIDQWVRETFEPRAWAWTDSGTTALTLALRLAAAERGSRRIALPAYGCYDLATACDGAEVEVLLYDIDPETLGPDWSSLEWALGEGAVSVVLVHQYGIPVDLDRARDLATAHGATVIEDAAQGIGGEYNRKPLGRHGDLSILSFGRGKGFSAGGGGLLLAHSARFIDAASELALPSARGFAAWAKCLVQAAFSAPGRFWIPAALPGLGLGETVYHPPHRPGGLSRSGAGLLAAGCTEQDHAVGARREVAAAWADLLPPGWRIDPEGPAAIPGYLRFPILLPSEELAASLRASGAAFGVGPSYPSSLADLSGFEGRVLKAGGWKADGARTLAKRLLTLPSHVYVDQRVMESIAGVIRRLPASRS